MAGFVLLVALLLAGTTATAQASYGEIGKPFGEKGKTAGKFIYSGSVHALGVDPTDNSVYVGDEPTEGSESSSEYRIQKFSSSGTPEATVSFKVKAEAKAEGGNPAGLEGIAVDPELKRVYALVVYEREEEEGTGRENENKKIEKENEKLIKEGKQPLPLIPPRIDAEEPAAGTLYAFSTTPSGKELVPAENEGKPLTEGVLASKVVLKAQSEITANPAESAIMDPAGIAVDPKTHDVIILGREDRGSDTGLPHAEELVTAAQRVKSNGTLGARWVDTNECFEGEGEEESPNCFEQEPGELGGPVPGDPASPVVTQSGRVLVDVLEKNQIWEIPQAFGAGEVPKPALQFNNPLQTLLSFPGNPNSEQGGVLTYVHESGEPEAGGRLYQAGELLGLAFYPSVISFQLSATGTASEIGWTAGQNAAQEKETPCSISVFTQPVLGAGTGEKVFVFDANKTSTEPANPHVVIFGPGGKGCPTDSADGPAVTANGQTIGTAQNPAHAGQMVSLSSHVTQGNALKVAWNFGDGTTQEVTTPQYQTTSVEHAFASVGEKKVVETIDTDNLEKPTIEQTVTVNVAPSEPKASFSSSAATVNQPVKFTSTSPPTDLNGSALVKYTWTFGDGGTATGATAEHTFSEAKAYTVTLQVTDALGLAGSTSHTITVASSSGGGSPPAPPPPPPATTPTTTTPPTTSVQGFTGVKGNPAATLASTSLSVIPSGSFVIKVKCPAGETTCSGSVTLKTLSAVSAGAKKKKTILTLASGSFAVAGGATKSVTLHLSAAARRLLGHSHVLRARATILAHDSTGASHTALTTVTLKPAKKSAHH